MPVGLLSRAMSSSEFMKWIAFSRIEPFGSEIDDYRAGTAAAAVYNVNRASVDAPVIAPLALFEWHEKPAPPEDTPEQTAEKLRQFQARQDELRKKLKG